MWMIGTGVLLGTFYVMDRRNYLRAPPEVRQKLAGSGEQWRFEGLQNLFFLALILGAVFLENPPLLREGLMLLAAVGSYFTTSKATHLANEFNFHPIREVAILFTGIFATMMPALDWLEAQARTMEHPSIAFFYWGSGLLSSGLDNAPTYLGFLRVLYGAFISPENIQQVQLVLQNGPVDPGALSEPVRQTYIALQKYHSGLLTAGAVGKEQIEVAYLLGNPALSKYILAISIGSVFFGANTYIGNGPNFLVKSIADHQKVHTPDFMGYFLKYAVPYLGPVLLLMWWLFFRG
jgi:Na+/H+ antiporter NhaD/arsenite permease-like protein